MIKKDTLIKNYTKQVAELEELLANKLLKISTADSGKESRYPTGRIELENSIQQLQTKLDETKDLLKTLKRLPVIYDKSTVSIGCIVAIEMDNELLEFIIVPEIGDYNLGVLSIKSALGKALIGRKVGDLISLDDSTSAKIISIS